MFFHTYEMINKSHPEIYGFLGILVLEIEVLANNKNNKNKLEFFPLRNISSISEERIAFKKLQNNCLVAFV